MRQQSKLRLALRRDLHPTFESRAIVCAWSTRSSLWARDLVAHAMSWCSMKRKSTILPLQLIRIANPRCPINAAACSSVLTKIAFSTLCQSAPWPEYASWLRRSFRAAALLRTAARLSTARNQQLFESHDRVLNSLLLAHQSPKCFGPLAHLQR